MNPGLAYAAGFVEADGHISIGCYRPKSKNPGYTAVLSIVNANPAPLEYIKTLIGGKIYTRSTKNPNHSTTYALQLTSRRKISDALELIIPFMVGKKDVAVLVKEFCDSRLASCPHPGQTAKFTKREVDIFNEVHSLSSKFYKKPKGDICQL